jgi:hypothetical protein
MRFIIGIIAGFLITVAVAYWHDSGARPIDAGGSRDQIVNWDVADRAFRNARDSVTRGFNRLIGERDVVPEDRRERL